MLKKQDVIDAIETLDKDIEAAVVSLELEDDQECWDRNNIANWENMQENFGTVKDYIRLLESKVS